MPALSRIVLGVLPQVPLISFQKVTNACSGKAFLAKLSPSLEYIGKIKIREMAVTQRERGIQRKGSEMNYRVN